MHHDVTWRDVAATSSRNRRVMDFSGRPSALIITDCRRWNGSLQVLLNYRFRPSLLITTRERGCVAKCTIFPVLPLIRNTLVACDYKRGGGNCEETACRLRSDADNYVIEGYADLLFPVWHPRTLRVKHWTPPPTCKCINYEVTSENKMTWILIGFWK